MQLAKIIQYWIQHRTQILGHKDINIDIDGRYFNNESVYNVTETQLEGDTNNMYYNKESIESILNKLINSSERIEYNLNRIFIEPIDNVSFFSVNKDIYEVCNRFELAH